jgi:membrane-associated phospholipid phosphatase
VDADPDAQATGDPIRRFADVVSVASDFGAVWVLVSALQVLRRQLSVTSALTRLASAGVVSLALTRCLKHLFSVPRATAPLEPTLARTPSSPGFPSGHTLAAFTSALAIPVTTRGRLVAIVISTLVAWSRVRVGHHGPADVVAGAAVGAAAGGALSVLLPVASAAG